jgi:hypothetical protein
MSAVNYRYVFKDLAPRRTWRQEWRFWRVQFVDLLRVFVYSLHPRHWSSWPEVLGKIEGIIAATRL